MLEEQELPKGRPLKPGLLFSISAVPFSFALSATEKNKSVILALPGCKLRPLHACLVSYVSVVPNLHNLLNLPACLLLAL